MVVFCVYVCVCMFGVMYMYEWVYVHCIYVCVCVYACVCGQYNGCRTALYCPGLQCVSCRRVLPWKSNVACIGTVHACV